MLEKTLAIIKPDLVASGKAGTVLDLIELNKFNIVKLNKLQLTRSQVQEFYAIHKDKPFFGELTDYMSSGPVIVMVLEKDNAVQEWRDLMGATNPAKAAIGTLRKMFGQSMGVNGFHGSDAQETAQQEVKFFFKEI